MNTRITSRLGAFAAAAALTAAFGLGAAFAGDGATTSEKTKLKFKHGDTVETIQFEGALTVGQSVGLYSEAGTPVTVTRTDKGLRIEFPDRTHEVPFYSNPGTAGPSGGERKIVIIKKDGGAGEHAEDMEWIDSETDPEIQAAIDEALAETGGQGEVRKVIIKHVEHQETTAEQGTD